MTTARPRRLAPFPALVLLVCALFAGATPILAAVVTDPREDVAAGVAVVAFRSLLLLTWSVVGALAASRLPGNPLGWLFLVAGVSFSVGPFVDLYAAGVPADGGHLPGRTAAAWGANLLLQNPAVFGLFAVILLLFPDGRPRTARWRPFVRVLVAALVIYTAVLALKPGSMAESVPPTDNPLGIAAAEAVWPFVDLPLAILFLVGMLAGLTTMVQRFRRARGAERQQMKWLGAGAGVLVVAVLSGPLLFWPNPALNRHWHVVFVTALTVLPFSAGIAILRYRLFDVDRIISRTLSYAIVVGLLALGYAGVALTVQAVAGPALGGSDLLVAAATLAAAAAFRPLHARVRGMVDRRFNRRAYDAERALAGFGAQVRDELDLSSAGRAVEELVRSTLEPTSVRLWVAR